MAGLWGARNSNDRRLLAELGGEIVEAPPRDYWDYDQVSVIGKSRNVQFKKTPTSVCHMLKKIFELMREDGVGEGALFSAFLERSSVSHCAPPPPADRIHSPDVSERCSDYHKSLRFAQHKSESILRRCHASDVTLTQEKAVVRCSYISRNDSLESG